VQRLGTNERRRCHARNRCDGDLALRDAPSSRALAQVPRIAVCSCRWGKRPTCPHVLDLPHDGTLRAYKRV